jgi:hypothetical protein
METWIKHRNHVARVASQAGLLLAGRGPWADARVAIKSYYGAARFTTRYGCFGHSVLKHQ